MYGSLNQPEPIANLKKRKQRLLIGSGPIGWGPQKEDAAERIHEAIVQGKLSVFVLPASTNQVPLQVPLDVLERMIRARGGLPDRAIEPLRIFAKEPITAELRVALSQSDLYLQRSEFDAWYKEAQKKRNWPSQRSSCKPRMGRPPKQNDLRTPIVVLVNEGRWSTQQTIADLVRLLELKAIIADRDTARRVVDQLFKETGEQCYRRCARSRSPR